MVVNGELDRLRTGYYPPFWSRTEMQYLKTVVPKFEQVGSLLSCNSLSPCLPSSPWE